MRTGTTGLAIVSVVSLIFAFKVYKDNKNLHDELEGAKISMALATERAERYQQLAEQYKQYTKKLKREQS